MPSPLEALKSKREDLLMEVFPKHIGRVRVPVGDIVFTFPSPAAVLVKGATIADTLFSDGSSAQDKNKSNGRACLKTCSNLARIIFEGEQSLRIAVLEFKGGNKEATERYLKDARAMFGYAYSLWNIDTPDSIKVLLQVKS